MADLCEGDNEPPGFLKSVYTCDIFVALLAESFYQCYVEYVFAQVTKNDFIFRPVYNPAIVKRIGAKNIKVSSDILTTNICWNLQPHSFLQLTKFPNEMEEEKQLVGSLVEKKFPSEGCTGKNGELEESSGQKKILRYQMIDGMKIYGSHAGTKRKAENREDCRMLGLQWNTCF
ncbi:hypothetical protein ANN_01127 [Periplaneta americana]|uniref:Uncharacterized protein n=1 Tax=Periplaneta americana TaxID=6978 RepID=A0ABQ8TTT8_PERAM|nr:hypothetical protein ANN_01127 [Periplaneta americana]